MVSDYDGKVLDMTSKITAGAIRELAGFISDALLIDSPDDRWWMAASLIAQQAQMMAHQTVVKNDA